MGFPVAKAKLIVEFGVISFFLESVDGHVYILSNLCLNKLLPYL